MKEQYTTKEVCKIYGYSQSGLCDRARIRNIPKRYVKNENNGGRIRVFCKSDIDKIKRPITVKKFKHDTENKLPNVLIYDRVLTFHIYESRLNYTPLTKL